MECHLTYSVQCTGQLRIGKCEILKLKSICLAFLITGVHWMRKFLDTAQKINS